MSSLEQPAASIPAERPGPRPKDGGCWRRGPDRGWLGDRKLSSAADLLLLGLAAAAAAVFLTGTEGLLRAIVVLVLACLLPGAALLTRIGSADTVEGFALAVTLGVSILTAAALAMIWTGWWHPAAVSCGLGAISCLLLIGDLARSPLRWRGLGSAAAVRNRLWSRERARSGARMLALWMPAALSLALWLVSLRGVDVYHLGSYGLPPALPPAWYLALAISVCGAVTVASIRSGSGLLMAAYIVVAAIILFGTVPALSGNPHYAWVYKHIGVVRYLEQHGSVDLNADIYNRWPGFFALAAMLSPIAGRANPVTYAAWADLFFQLLDMLLLAAIVRALVRDARIAAGAALLFLLTNWVGQTYFSPQAFGFVLGMGVLLVFLRHLRAGAQVCSSRLLALGKRVGRVSQDAAIDADHDRWPRAAAIAAVLGVFAMIVASHQLTPYILLVGLAGLMAAGIVRPWWVLIPMAAMSFAYLGANLGFIQQHYGLFTSIDPFNNVQGVDITPNTPVPGKVFNTDIQLVLIGLLWIGGAVASIRLLRRGTLAKALPLVILGLSPFVVVFAQSYGGEAPLRIILFSSPWFAALISWGTATIARPRLQLTIRMATGLTFAALFIPAFLGQEELNVIGAAEVRASAHFYRHARPGAVLVLAAPGFPYRYGANYPLFSGPEGDANPNLLTEPNFQSRALGAAQVPAIVARIHQYSRHGYLAFSRDETLYARIFNITPPGAMASLEAAVAHSPDFRLWYRNERVRIYELIAPSGRDATT